MSGYLSGVLAIFCVNLIFAYGIFVTAAAGQIQMIRSFDGGPNELITLR